MIRDHIAEALELHINRLAEIERSLLAEGGLQYMDETRSAKTKWQTFHDRVKAAAPGYSGFFEAVKIGSEELEKIYSFDEAQIRYVDRFDEALSALVQAVKDKTGIAETIAALGQVATEANEAFGLRDDVLTKLDKSL